MTLENIELIRKKVRQIQDWCGGTLRSCDRAEAAIKGTIDVSGFENLPIPEQLRQNAINDLSDRIAKFKNWASKL